MSDEVNSIDLDDLHNQEETPVNSENSETDLEITNLESDNDDNDVNNNSDNDDTVLTGTEKFLSQYGILGGMIKFEDGSEKHYESLDQDEQFNVLKSIAEGSKTPIEQEYDLDSDEIELLNYIRDQRKPVNEVIQDILDAQLQKIDAIRNINNEDYINMSKESIYLKWLQEADPEATEAELEESLDAAKKLKTFDKTTESLRNGFINEQDRFVQLQEAQMQQEQFRELESDRETIVNVVESIQHVAGWPVSDEQKNEILGSLLEVNSQGDSLFMERVFSDPEKLFKVAWLDAYGDSQFDIMADHYKNEISNAYKKGKNEGINGLPSSPIKLGDNRSSNKRDTAVINRDQVNAIDLDKLHED
jgi:hypothetical protein